MTTSAPNSISLARRLGPLALPFAGLFVLSGMAGLIYQVVWSRLLVTVFGVTSFAVATVLVSFMGGMALGAALLGRRADASARPLRMFAMLEGGIGLYALVLPLLLKAVDPLYSALFVALPESFLLRSIVRFAVCLALLLVPTMLMGATLPALGQGLLRRKESLGFGIGLLYFVNTLGAAVGTYVAGFWLLPHLGLTRSTLVAFALNATVASVAFALDRRTAPSAPEGSAAETSVAEPLCVPASWPLWVAAGSGLCALAFEVVWFRVLVLVFGSTVYSFSAMLSVFLLGIALGSLLLGGYADRSPHPVRLLAITQGAVATFALGGSLFVNLMPDLFLRLLATFGFDFDGMNRTKLALSFLTMLPPALAFGANFPVAVRLAETAGRGTGSRIGRVYAWNTVGAIAGSFLTGFVFLPTIGMERTLLVVIVLAALLAFGSLLAEPGPLRLRWAVPSGAWLVAVVAIALVGPRWNRTLLGAGVYVEPQQFVAADGTASTRGVVADYTLKTFTEGFNETIISFESPKGKFITVNGSATASDHFEDMVAQTMLAHLPMALHPGPVRDACVVCLGAGVTAGTLGLYEVDRFVGVELEKGVFVASRFFSDVNHALLDNPRLELRIDDGRNYLKLTKDTFDVISSAPNFPSLTGSGSLFTREFFAVERDRLAPGGTVSQFLPIWRMRPEDVRTIAATFADVYPHVRLFSTGVTVVMLGRKDPFPPVDATELSRRVARPEIAASLGIIGIRGPVELLSFYQMDEGEIRRWTRGAPLNTDDRPLTEFNAPRALFDATVGRNMAQIAAFRPPPEERARRLGLTGEWASSFVALASGYDAVTIAEDAMEAGRVDEALAILEPVAASGQRYARYLLADFREKQGQTAQRAGRLDEAKAAFEDALRWDPDLVEALAGIGQIEMFAGHLERADVLLTRAAQLAPRSGGALYRLGALREVQGRAPEAEALFRQAIERQPLLAKPWALLGGLLLGRGDAAAAAQAFERAVELGDESANTASALAEARRRR